MSIAPDAQTAGRFLRRARDAQQRLLEAAERIDDAYLRSLLAEALATLERAAAAVPQGRVDRPAHLRPAAAAATDPVTAGAALAGCAKAFGRLRDAGVPLAAELGGERGAALQRLVGDLERVRGLFAHLADPERLERLLGAHPAELRGTVGGVPVLRPQAAPPLEPLG